MPLPARTEAELIDRILHSPRRAELLRIGDARRAATIDSERRRNWDAVQVILDLDSAVVRFGSTFERDLLWHIRSRSAGSDGDERSSIPLSPNQLAWIVVAFRVTWPATSFSSGMTAVNSNPGDASNYIQSLISRLGSDHSDVAVAAMRSLDDAISDGYTYHIRSVSAEQQRRRVEHAYTPPRVDEIAAIIANDSPRTSADLQAATLEHLSVVQSMIRNSDVDWYRGFFLYEKHRKGDKGPFTYKKGQHKDEEACRDELVKMLRTMRTDLEYIPESHVAEDKRVDVVVHVNEQLILPIEIKGQWHRELWTAADTQLDHLYVSDWRAERGIYLVFWFGEDIGIVRPPDGVAVPKNPNELLKALISTSRAAQDGRVDVVVLDLSRPASG